MIMKFEPATDPQEGEVAYMKMPLKLSAMDVMNTFVKMMYGPGCVCDEHPKGWLRISKPTTEKGETTK